VNVVENLVYWNILMSIKSHTDLVVLDTLVHLVRQVPWGPGRDQLEQVAENNRVACDALVWAGAWDHFNRLAWEAELHTLAAEGRFPREGDKAIAKMTDAVIDQIRDMQVGKKIGYPFPGHIAIREGVQLSLTRNGFDLETLPVPPTLHELIDRGEERPVHVSQERWDKAIAAYNHAMTLENTPDDFIHSGP
jgi:hypothetical protein